LESDVNQSPVQTKTIINSTAFDLGQVNNASELHPSQNEDILLQSPSPTASFNKFQRVETSRAFDGSLCQIVNTLGLQSFRNEDYQISPSSSFNTKQGDISTVATNTQKLTDVTLMIEPAAE
jgi:hypothetical protein